MLAGAEKKRERLLVFVVAYYAESTLEQVLGRMPENLLREYEVLVIAKG